VEVFREVGLLIAQCDGYIDALNMYSLEPATPLPISKGVTSFTVHVVGGSYFVTLEVKKRLVIYEYTGRYELIKELQLNEVPLDLAWIGSAKVGAPPPIPRLAAHTHTWRNRIDRISADHRCSSCSCTRRSTC
jgi:hypothetical protein